MQTLFALGYGFAFALAQAAPSAPAPNATTRAANDFLHFFNSIYLGLTRVASEAEWVASTDVGDAHDAARTAADTALAVFQGDKNVIETTRSLLGKRKQLPPLLARQLDKVILGAAEGPGTIPDVTAARVAAESAQSSTMNGYTFKLDGKPVTANDLDDILQKSRDLAQRRRAWEASKEIGRPLKPGLEKLQKLRNQVARELKFASFNALQVADYDMTEQEMMDLLDGFLTDTRPLYVKLHAWVRSKLAERYRQPAPKGLIPAHWITNRWAQQWTGIVEGAADLDPLLKDKTAEWIVKSGERFYVSMGFPPLPKTFWEKSDLYPVPAAGKRKKNQHASAWHIDLDRDVRSLMSVKPNDQWWGTAHHELGHIYYYISYSRPEVPPILRRGANRAFHETVGDLAAIASKQVPYLKAVGVLPQAAKIDMRAALLDEALETIPFLAWSAGTMSHFERDLYSEDLKASEWQRRWWELVAKYQGVEPPGPRPADACDACTKTHINDDPAQYYDYAMDFVIKYQLHDHICKKILKQDPHTCNYYGSKAVGNFLRKILEQGAMRPWRDVIREATGEPVSTRALREYFAALDPWLDGELKGKPVGW